MFNIQVNKQPVTVRVFHAATGKKLSLQEKPEPDVERYGRVFKKKNFISFLLLNFKEKTVPCWPFIIIIIRKYIRSTNQTIFFFLPCLIFFLKLNLSFGARSEKDLKLVIQKYYKVPREAQVLLLRGGGALGDNCAEQLEALHEALARQKENALSNANNTAAAQQQQQQQQQSPLSATSKANNFFSVDQQIKVCCCTTTFLLLFLYLQHFPCTNHCFLFDF